MAYVTVLSTDNYLEGVLALDESLRLCKSKYKLYVLVGSKVSGATQAMLERAGIRTIPSEPINVPEDIMRANLTSDYHKHWVGVFEKLYVFSLCEFEKIVYIDSDMLVIKNIDELFEKPHMSAVIADRYPGNENCADLNAGLMVIEPEAGLTDRLMATLPEAFEREKEWRRAAGRPASMGVQSVINYFWHDWVTRDELHLDGTYNVLADHMDYYVRKLGYTWRGPDGIRVLHFIGEVKPWMGPGLARRVAGLLVRRRMWELAGLLAHVIVLRRAGQRITMAAP